MGQNKLSRKYLIGFDNLLLFLVLVCTFIGCVLIFSATYSLDGNRNIIVQTICFLIGLIFVMLISRVDYEIFERIALILFIVSVLALILTFFIAEPIKGNRNWIDFKIIKIQTSEITKNSFIITLSILLYKLRKNVSSPLAMLIIILHFACYAIPIILQGDIGSLLVYVFILVVTLFVARLNWMYFVGAAVFITGAFPLVWNFLLKDYMKKRILITFDPYLDPLGAGYQQIQSQIALGSGGLFGNGYMKGIQTQYGLLPEKHTDFIFSVLGEEFGFLGCLVVILILLSIIVRVFYIGVKCEHRIGKYICFGVGTMLLAQTVENIGMCCGILPIIGITLPLISYGGSSCISAMISIGLVESVAVHSNFSERRRLGFR